MLKTARYILLQKILYLNFRGINMVGREIRLSRILNPDTKKTMIIAIDHGTAMYPRGIADPINVLKKTIQAKPDAILLNRGIIRLGRKFLLGKEIPGIILRLDWTGTWRKSARANKENVIHVFSVQDAVKVGADAVLAYLFYGPETGDDLEASCTQDLGNLVRECEVFGMPLIVEAHLSPLASEEDRRNPIYLSQVTRAAAELGADLIKTEYTGNVDTFSEVVKNCPIPITILGGPKAVTDREVLVSVRGAIDSGAAGVTIGRNVWQHKNPAGMAAAIKGIIHRDLTVEEALKLI
jgi:fructose-bisphosphate aldolase/2-amino-3,7-dideoxy-D-threo-hept-6-ulosonate synthase